MNKLFIASGIFLIIEAIASILYSFDQRKISQAGRIIRVAIGGMLIYYGVKK